MEQKRIKRKEYATVQDFIDAVDLVFSNAMEFNEEHSEIWEDAMTMKVRVVPSLFMRNPLNDISSNTSTKL